MGSAWDQLEQMLTCAICLDKFKNPRLLPCQHSFCGDSCMDGLVDYARRQIKCPECRAEHRIPYNGVSSLPINVTLIRFLELHSRITGEEPEPVPTFLEKCSVCGEKVDGVQRCAHCEKKVCPDCRVAHIDILRREVGRVNGQSKRCLNKMQDFREQVDKAQERLKINHATVKREIQDSCRRLIEDLQAKQKRLIEEVDTFVDQENKTLDKLRSAAIQEYEVLDSNSKLAEDKIQVTKYQWSDAELWEMKEIYTKAMEFIRLFDADLGDFNRKIRFMIIPEFDTMRKRICDLGELKFSESTTSLMATALQYCNATGHVAIEICQNAAAQAAAQMANMQGAGGYSLAYSNSNSNIGGPGGIQAGASNLLELPSMQNALMRSQSDHRLASQFQQRLKQQQQQQQLDGKSGGRYGAMQAPLGRDYETESLRSRYAPPRSTVAIGTSAAKDFNPNDLTRDWPRPGDNDADGLPFGSSIQFKSAFMRRKGQYSGNPTDDDDDLVSEASYGGGTRNVRFSEQGDQLALSRPQMAPRLFDCKDLEHGPFSGVPKLEDAPNLLTRLHQMGAKAVVDKKQAEEETRKDKELVESARQAMNQAAKKMARKASEDEIEKQKRANKQQQTQPEPDTNSSNNENVNRGADDNIGASGGRDSQRQRSSTPTNEVSSRSRPTIEAEPMTPSQTSSTVATTTASQTGDQAIASRKSLYSQAITEKSKRQLANAIQEASSYSRRRASTSVDPSFDESTRQEASPDAGAQSGTSPKSVKTRRVLRSSSRSMSKQGSNEQLNDTGTIQRRPRRLNRADSSQQSLDQAIESSKPKNSMTGSGGQSDSSLSLTADQNKATSSQKRSPMLYHSTTASTTTDQTSNTTDDDDNAEEEPSSHSSKAKRATTTRKFRLSSDNDSDEADRSKPKNRGNDSDQDSDDDLESSNRIGGKTASKRLSRELLPNAVNKLLDRSAQIRRDSQEQRSRGDSPQRSYQGSTTASSGSYSSSPRNAASSSSYYSSTSASARPRFSYQRSGSQTGGQTNRGDDGSSANSSNSVYTTASSQGSRKGSNDDESSYSSSALSRGRLSGNSTESTIVSASRDLGLQSRRSAYGRQDSSGESSASPKGSGFQSRFLSKSRTASALASGSANESNDSSNDHQARSGGEGSSTYSNRSNLSSRDRFMQSANAAISGTSTSGSGSSNLYGRGGSSTVPTPAYTISNLGQYRHQPASQAYYSDDSPFIELDDEDEQYSAYFPAGFEAQSEYLKRKLSEDPNSSRSSSLTSSSRMRPSQVVSDEEGNTIGSIDDIENEEEDNSIDTYGENSVEDSDMDVRCLFKYGYRGNGQGQFTWPRGVATDGEEIAVADSSNHRVQIFDNEGNFKQQLGSYGSAEAQFDCLTGLWISGARFDSSRYIVSDRYNHRIQIFDRSGNFVRAFGEMGRGLNQLNMPWGVTRDNSSGLIYLCDKENNRVQVFDEFGNHKAEIGQSSEMKFPHYLAVWSGRLAVTDTNNHRVKLFDLSTGQDLFSFGSEGSGSGQFKFPRGVAIDGNGSFIVGDSGNNRIQIFGEDGKFIKTYGTWGSSDGQFKGIEGIAMDIDRRRVFVCDRENHRIQTLELLNL